MNHVLLCSEHYDYWWVSIPMCLLPDTYSRGLRMRRESRERFLRHRLQRKPLVSDPGMHHGTCVTHVPLCMSGSLTPAGGENVPGIPGAWATRKFAYLARGPCGMTSLVTVMAKSVSHTVICGNGSWWISSFSPEEWSPFHRRHFQTHFLRWKSSIFDKNFTEVCS